MSSLFRSIHRIKRIFRRFTHLGVKSFHSRADVVRIILLNKVSLMVALLIVFNCIVYITTAKWQLLLTSLILLVPWILILFFNYRNLLHISKIVMVVTSGMTITILSFLYSFSSGITFYFVAAAVGTFCLYSSEEKRALFLSSVFYLILYAFSAFFFDEKPYLTDVDDELLMFYFRHSSFFFTLILTTFFVYFLNTENKEIEKALIRAKEKAERADSAKSRFLSMMSHEIRTPISTIIGFSDLLQSEGDKHKQEMYLKNLHVSGNSLLSIVNEILDLSSLENGNIKYQPESFSIHALMEEIIPTFLPVADGKKLSIQYVPTGEIGLFHLTDRKLLNQILLNLIHNALKFTDNGSVSIQLSIEKPDRLQMSAVEIRVIDTGIGFSPHEKEFIFDRFSQVSEDINRKFGGAGLGLYIVQELLKILGGEIHVESTPGKGSEFRLEFLFKSSEPIHEIKVVEEKIEVYSFKGRHFLLAEDDPFNAMITKYLLEEWQAEVTHVMNGLEALEAAREKKFDAIIMDVQMPECDGISATKEIRNRQEGINHETPIIGYTANVSHDERVLGMKAGMNDYLIKPVRKEHLYQSLKTLIH